jgi:hypothetical protein
MDSPDALSSGTLWVAYFLFVALPGLFRLPRGCCFLPRSILPPLNFINPRYGHMRADTNWLLAQVHIRASYIVPEQAVRLTC